MKALQNYMGLYSGIQLEEIRFILHSLE